VKRHVAFCFLSESLGSASASFQLDNVQGLQQAVKLS